MTRLKVSFAASSYDRLHALETGTVKPEGLNINFINLPVEETFFRQIRFEEFDVCEMSLSSYTIMLDQACPSVVAIPAFPSRYFRHQTMFVNADSGIESPGDLAGKKVGVPEYQITAGVWQRGMLQDQYGVYPHQMRFFSGGVDQVGRREKIAVSLPKNASIQPIGPTETLSDMLRDGDIDALFTANVPACFYQHSHIRRLFPDYKKVEQDYFRATGLFPIMHVIVIRKDLYERHPWMAQSLMKSLSESLKLARQGLMYRSSLKTMLPWLAHHVEETVDVMGEDYWTYGIDANRHVLETFLRYSYEQGLASIKWRPEDLFVRNVAETYVV